MHTSYPTSGTSRYRYQLHATSRRGSHSKSHTRRVLTFGWTRVANRTFPNGKLLLTPSARIVTVISRVSETLCGCPTLFLRQSNVGFVGTRKYRNVQFPTSPGVLNVSRTHRMMDWTFFHNAIVSVRQATGKFSTEITSNRRFGVAVRNVSSTQKRITVNAIFRPLMK